MKISILGLGKIGLPLGLELKKKGYSVSGSTTSGEKKHVIENQEINVFLLKAPALPELSCDVLIINIPPFPDQEKWFSLWDLSKVKKVIFVSSTSALREHPILKVEEEWIKSLTIPWLIVRPAGLIGDNRHPGKSLSGRKDIKGRLHPVNLIHHDDVIGFIMTAIAENISGETIELVSDEHRSKEEFYTEYCRKNSLRLPEFDLTDGSTGKIIPNMHMKKYYELKYPRLNDKSR